METDTDTDIVNVYGLLEIDAGMTIDDATIIALIAKNKLEFKKCNIDIDFTGMVLLTGLFVRELVRELYPEYGGTGRVRLLNIPKNSKGIFKLVVDRTEKEFVDCSMLQGRKEQIVLYQELIKREQLMAEFQALLARADRHACKEMVIEAMARQEQLEKQAANYEI